MSGELEHYTHWQHKKSGGLYVLIGQATIEATDTDSVMYRSLNACARQDIWVRPKSEFLEKFKRIEASIYNRTFAQFDLVRHLETQIEFSLDTFGPGTRTKGLIDHITKELEEVRKAPTDLGEWIDLMMLSLDGAWRAGHKPKEICSALKAKLEKNMARDWPDWRTADPDKALRSVRRG